MRRKFLRQSAITLLASTFALLGSPTLAADDWPAAQPIELIVPFGPGSSPDTMARKVAEHAGEALGQTIVIQNKPGASGNLGTNLIAKAKPDGYTFGVSITGPMVNNTILYSDLPYDPVTDLDPLTLAVHQYNVLVVPEASPMKSFQDLLDALKDPENDFNFPSTGAGTVSHLSVELLLEHTGGNAVHVPYASSPKAVTSLIAGDTDFSALPPIAVMPMVKDERLRALATVSAERLDFLPDVPTVNEFDDLSGIEGSGWMGFVAPAGMPEDIKTRLTQALRDALNDDDIKAHLKNQYMEAVGNSPEEFRQYMDDDLERWGPLIKRLDLSVN